MKRWIAAMLLGGAIAVAARAAEEVFSKAVRPGDFAAAGLAKLSAEELARLDALVRDFKSGTLERARKEAVAAEARASQAEKRAAAAAVVATEREKPPPPGLLAKAKVLLTPGTQVEYATVESRIAGEFRGWEKGTVFGLENGQRWQAAGAESNVTPPVPGPAVKITPGLLGSFWMTIEGVRPRVKVALVGGGTP